MRNLDLKLIHATMLSCCDGYDKVAVEVTQDNGILLQWEYSNNGKPIMHLMANITKPMLSRVDDVMLSEGIMLLIETAKQRIQGVSI